MKKYDEEFERLVPNDLNVTRSSVEGENVAERIRDFYLGSRPVSDETAEEMIYLLTDEMFIHGILGTARMHAEQNDTKTFLYRFGYDGSLGLYKRLLAVNRPGVCHGDELGYLFYFGIINVRIDPHSSEALTKKRMVRMWTNFAKYG